MLLYDQLKAHTKLFMFSTIFAFSGNFLIKKKTDKWPDVSQLVLSRKPFKYDMDAYHGNAHLLAEKFMDLKTKLVNLRKHSQI